jgi:aspartate racemase
MGIIGGLSWESTAEYYRIVNEEVARRAGGLSSASLLLSSVDFSWYAAAMKAGRWEEIRDALLAEARILAEGGAEAILVASNTMHFCADEIAAATGLPFLHIADAAGRALREAGAKRAGLLGTVFTMEKPFYREVLDLRHGIETLVPPPGERREVDRIIFEELCRGIQNEAARVRLREVALGLQRTGAEAIVLGCTELPLVMKEGDIGLRYFDTTRLHALAAVDFMLGRPDAGA